MADNDKFCGDYPAPCNCDNPETHDGAVPEVIAPEARPFSDGALSVVNSRIQTTLEVYAGYVAHIVFASEDDTIVEAKTITEFADAAERARVAQLIKGSLTLHADDPAAARWSVNAIARTASSFAAMHFAHSLADELNR